MPIRVLFSNTEISELVTITAADPTVTDALKRKLQIAAIKAGATVATPLAAKAASSETRAAMDYAAMMHRTGQMTEAEYEAEVARIQAEAAADNGL